jgi:hypothetical protein
MIGQFVSGPEASAVSALPRRYETWFGLPVGRMKRVDQQGGIHVRSFSVQSVVSACLSTNFLMSRAQKAPNTATNRIANDQFMDVFYFIIYFHV